VKELANRSSIIIGYRENGEPIPLISGGSDLSRFWTRLRISGDRLSCPALDSTMFDAEYGQEVREALEAYQHFTINTEAGRTHPEKLRRAIETFRAATGVHPEDFLAERDNTDRIEDL
jgi:hypothetical protein